MSRTVRRVLIAILTVMFLGSGVMLVYRGMEYQKGEETYSEAETLAGVPDLSQLPPAPEESSGEAAEEAPQYADPYADALRSMDFTALREVNDNVLGWIVIPGTPISYPLVQGTDNQYYLRHTWKKTPGVVGAIFMESRCSADLGDFHTILYGHRMNNGSMFASLKNYKKQSYWAAHPRVYLTDDAGSHSYEIFAAYEVSTSGQTYQIGFSGEEKKQAFLDYCAAQSVIRTGITPTVHDRVLTLSTCTGNGHATRWVVQAVLRGAVPAGETKEPTPTKTTPETAPAETTQETTLEAVSPETVPESVPPETAPETADDKAAAGETAEADVTIPGETP